jgi:hypothetical protein
MRHMRMRAFTCVTSSLPCRLPLEDRLDAASIESLAEDSLISGRGNAWLYFVGHSGMIMKHEGGVHGSWFMVHHVVWLIVVSKFF